MLLEDERNKVIEIARKAKNERLMPLTFGNFSLRDPATGYICITPSGMDYDNIRAEDIVVIDSNRNIVEGKRKPSIESGMHCAVMEAREDVGGVVHVHSTFATVWACCNKGIPPVLAEGVCFFGRELRCAPFAMVGSDELAEVVVQTLEQDSAVLMGNHGLLVVGEDLDAGYGTAIIAEEFAKVAYYASLKGDAQVLPEKTCLDLQRHAAQDYGQ